MNNKIIYIKEKEFYDSYTWEKASYITYIGRIKRSKLTMEEAILPWRLPITWEKIKEKWKKIRERDPVWLFYDRYLWDKPSYRYYREKVNAWMPLHEAIKKDYKRAQFLKENKNKQWLVFTYNDCFCFICKLSINSTLVNFGIIYACLYNYHTNYYLKIFKR